MSGQLDLSFARSAGDLGVERASGKAERLLAGWIDRAAEDIRKHATSALAPFTIEQARVGTELPDGADARAWGAVTRRALVLGYIERTGGYAPAASSNGSPKPLYRRGPASRNTPPRIRESANARRRAT